jgi:hypothetical protein
MPQPNITTSLSTARQLAARRGRPILDADHRLASERRRSRAEVRLPDGHRPHRGLVHSGLDGDREPFALKGQNPNSTTDDIWHR